MKNGYTRKEISDRLDIGNETLRYYERKGFIPRPVRSESGYRVYSEDDLSRLKFIVKSKKMGFTLREISDTLNLLGRDRKINNRVFRDLLSSKISEIDGRISALAELKGMLEYFRENTDLADCALLNFYYKS